MLTPKTMNKFESDMAKAKKQHKNIGLLKEIMDLLVNEKQLEPKYKIIHLKANGRVQENAT